MVNKTVFNTYEYNSFIFLEKVIWRVFCFWGDFFGNLFLYFNASVGSCNRQGLDHSHHRVTTLCLGPGKPAALHLRTNSSFLAPQLLLQTGTLWLPPWFPEKNTFTRRNLSKVHVLSPDTQPFMSYYLQISIPGNLASNFWILTLLLKIVEFTVHGNWLELLEMWKSV